jgi:type IX secretion system PorP/SprF family membrane protein
MRQLNKFFPLTYRAKLIIAIEVGILINLGQISNAQQLPLYSQYTFNAFLLNPAVAGSEGYTSFNLTSREQWFGIEGAPRTYALSLQTRIMKRSFIQKEASVKKRYVRPLRSGKVGLGVYIYNDHAGQIDQTGAQFTYAYHLRIAKSQLSFGATFSLLQYMINKNALNMPDKNDDQITNNRLLIYVPDVNIGAYYSDENKYIGLSVLQLSHASLNISNYNDEKFLIYRHFYLTSGFKYELDEHNMLEPSFYFKTSEQFRMQMDITLKYIYIRKFWLGVGFRTGSTFIGSLGVNVNRFYAGYAYDYCSKGLINNSYGSHELMMAVKLGDNVRRYKWIERY